MKSALGALLAVARFGLCTAWLGCVLWLAGRVLNDRWHWSQYLFWLPAGAALVAACAGLVLLPAARPTRRPRRIGRRWVTLAAPFILCMAWIAWEWRVWNALRDWPPADAVRLVAWNPATDFIDDFAQRVASLSPAVVAVANRPAYTKWEVIKSAVGGAGAFASAGRLSIVSRFPIRRWGHSTLGITGSRAQLSVWRGGSLVSVDRGEALFAELDTTSLWGKHTIVWLVDLPSDPLLPRGRMFAQAAAALAAFDGSEHLRNGTGEGESLAAAAGFPPPDIVLGDFNTPRGSRSIRRLVGDLGDAHARAGVGPGLTWHRRGPLVGIDQAFVSPSLVVTGYGVKDMGIGQHLAQVIELSAQRR